MKIPVVALKASVGASCHDSAGVGIHVTRAGGAKEDERLIVLVVLATHFFL